MKRLSFAACVAVIGLTAACSSSRSSTLPVAPSPSAPVPAPPVLPQTLFGYVADTAFRPMAGVKVDVLSGPETGRQLTSDSDGRFSYVGLFAGVTMRASKEGYLGATQAVFVSQTSAQAWVSFQMAPLTPPVQVAGNYTLTITADSACAGLPDDARTRTYAATVTLASGSNAPPNTRFNGNVSGAQFAPYGNVFWIGVAGDYLGISTEGEGPAIVEQLGPKRYVAYSGSAGATVGTTGVTTISAPFTGLIEYCELKSEIGQYYDCSPALAAVREQCTSNGSRLILTRR